MVKVSYIQILWPGAIIILFKVWFLSAENLRALYLLQDIVFLVGLSRNIKGEKKIPILQYRGIFESSSVDPMTPKQLKGQLL